jgi:hypothetical protein
VNGQYSFSTPGQLGGIAITDPANAFGISNGGTISADFQFQQWNSGAWTGTVSNGNAPAGIGSYTGPVQFNGGAAGTFSGTTEGSLSGTGAGIVQ